MATIGDATRAQTMERELDEEARVEDASALPHKIVYEIIRRDGRDELSRTTNSLFWSGVAGGILISFSVLAEAIFRTYLPPTGVSYLVENLGYSLGFVLVIMSRVQLFTENPMTTVLPLMVEFTGRMLGRVARLWGLVLLANLVGAFFAGTILAYSSAIAEEFRPAITELSEHITGFDFWTTLWRGVPAGLLVAAIVWMMPQSNGQRLMIVIIFTWLIAAGDFTHVVAGSVEMAYLMVQGQLGIISGFGGFFLPALIGNVIGGTVIFAMIIYGQVRDELRDAKK